MEPWRARLEAGDPEGAWGLFLARYRQLILAVIRRLAYDEEDGADLFAHVCAALAARDMDRPRRYRDVPAGTSARFSTWLVTVVHRLAVDWYRHRDGRPRVTVPAALSPLQCEIFRHVFVERRRHAEAFELVSDGSRELSYHEFLRELAETYRIVEREHPKGVMRYLRAPIAAEETVAEDGAVAAHASETRDWLAGALASIPAVDRLLLRLYVVEGLRADEVARILELPNEKAVYNRAYRSLARLRTWFESQQIGPADL